MITYPPQPNFAFLFHVKGYARNVFRSDLAGLGNYGMDSIFEENQTHVRDWPASASSFQLHDDSPQTARVSAAQQLLFPASPGSLCDEIGLNWQAALRLQEEGWISFPLESTSQLDEAQEAELRFVGSLVLAGCDRNMLVLLLASLPRPYAYDLKRVYFDWNSRHWRLIPDPSEHPEAAFTDWVEVLVQMRDAGSLAGIVELAQDALARVRGR